MSSIRGCLIFEKALVYYERCLDIEKRLGEESNLCSTLNNISIAYKNLNEIKLAEEKALESLEIGLKYELAWDITTTYNILSIIYYQKKDFNKAINYAKKALEMADSFNGKNEVMEARKNLYKSYKQLGSYREALENHEDFIRLSEELASEENQKEIIRQELQYDYEKQAFA